MTSTQSICPKTNQKSDVLYCVLLLQYVKELYARLQPLPIDSSAKTSISKASSNVVLLVIST